MLNYSSKFKMHVPFKPWQSHSQDYAHILTYVQNKPHTSIVTALLVVISKNEKQSKCPTRDK